MNLEEGLPDAQLFTIKVADENFLDIIQFLSMVIAPVEYTMQQKKELVLKVTDFTLITEHMYKLATDEILQIYVLEHERHNILVEAHGKVVIGDYQFIGPGVCPPTCYNAKWNGDSIGNNKNEK